VEEIAMSVENSTRCTRCTSGELRPARLTVTLAYDGKSFSVDEDDALVCEACGDELIG
jgi:YgiT-type zinc finger domain-containing protein